MGGLFDYSKRAPAVPAPLQGAIQEYNASKQAWTSQSKRVKNCASSIELLYKDITRLNLLLRFLKSPQNDLVLKARLYTCVDIDSKISKLLWKFSQNTMIRCDFVNIKSLPPLSILDKTELSQPSHPHHTPGIHIKHNQDEKKHKKHKKNQEKLVKVEKSFVLGINEFYYLFLFLEDKLPELASWLMKQSDENENNILLKALSNNIHLLNKNEKNHNPLIVEEEKEEKKENDDDFLYDNNDMKQLQLQHNEIEDEHCIICFEKMVDPICLTCSHEFCKQCIEDWQQQIGGKDCPICRCMIEQSQMWIKLDSQDFSKAQYMMELLQFPFQYVAKFEKWEDTMV